MSKADSIRRANPVIWKSVDCPEWKDENDDSPEPFLVWVKAMPGPQYDDFERVSMKKNYLKKNPFEITERFVKACAYDEQDGQLLFSDFSTADLKALNPQARGRVLDMALALSGVTQKDADELQGN